MKTADCILQTGGEMQTESKMQTVGQESNEDCIQWTGDRMQTEGKLQTSDQV